MGREEPSGVDSAAMFSISSAVYVCACVLPRGMCSRADGLCVNMYVCLFFRPYGQYVCVHGHMLFIFLCMCVSHVCM